MNKKLIEKVAKAIWEAGEAPVPWSKLYNHEQEEWRVMAKAAIIIQAAQPTLAVDGAVFCRPQFHVFIEGVCAHCGYEERPATKA